MSFGAPNKHCAWTPRSWVIGIRNVMTAPAPLITTAKFSDCFVSTYFSPPPPHQAFRGICSDVEEAPGARWQQDSGWAKHVRSLFLGTRWWKPLTAPVAPLVQTCSQASCAALCIAPSAPTTPTPSMCSAICRCPSPNEAPLGRSRSGTVWISFRKKRNWTRRIHQYVMFSSSPPADIFASWGSS